MNDKETLFIKLFIENGGNATQAAIGAGYSENRARQTGWELTRRNTEVMAAIAKVNAVQKSNLSDGDVSIDEIFEANINTAIKTLASQSSDPKGAEVFYNTYLKNLKQRDEKLGEYANLSTAELIREVDTRIKELQEIKGRVLEEIGIQEVQRGSDISS